MINWFHIQLYQIPAQEFLQIIGDVISSDEKKNKKATARFEEIMREAQDLKSEYDNWKKEEKGEAPHLQRDGPGGPPLFWEKS